MLLGLFGLESKLIWVCTILIGFIHLSLQAYVIGPNKELIKPKSLGLNMFRLYLAMSVFKLRCETPIRVELVLSIKDLDL